MENRKMTRSFVFGAVASMLMLWYPTRGVRADEIGDLKKQIQDQAKQLRKMQERLEQLEARQRLKEKSLNRKIEAVEDKQEHAAALPENLKWAEKIEVSGDLRYRHEHIDTETTGSSVRWKNGRDRDRIRARVNIDAEVNEEWDARLRIASGERDILVDEDLDADMFADPVSANQTLKQNFSSKDIWLDLAYFNWHPVAMDGLDVFGGKIKNPFYAAGKSELIWDHDLNPEGVGANYVLPLNDQDQFYVNGGSFWVDESSSGVDTSLWGIQGYIKHTIGNPDYILGGVSYWDYGNIKGKTDKYGILAGNAADPTGTKWASDYDLIEAFGEYGTKCWGLPVAVFGNWVQNLVAKTSGDTGWLIGAKLNKAKDPGSWQLRYNYRELETDAVLGAFTDSDFIGGGTNGRGHEFGFTYQLAKNLQGAVTYFHNENGRVSGVDLDYRRLQADLKLKF